MLPFLSLIAKFLSLWYYSSITLLVQTQTPTLSLSVSLFLSLLYLGLSLRVFIPFNMSLSKCLPTLLRYRYVGRQLYKARSPGWRNCFHTWRISLKNKQTKRICAKHILMIAVNMSCQLKRKRAWALGAGRDQMCKGSWGQWHNFHSKQKVGQKCQIWSQ